MIKLIIIKLYHRRFYPVWGYCLNLAQHKLSSCLLLKPRLVQESLGYSAAHLWNTFPHHLKLISAVSSYN